MTNSIESRFNQETADAAVSQVATAIGKSLVSNAKAAADARNMGQHCYAFFGMIAPAMLVKSAKDLQGGDGAEIVTVYPDYKITQPRRTKADQNPMPKYDLGKGIELAARVVNKAIADQIAETLFAGSEIELSAYYSPSASECEDDETREVYPEVQKRVRDERRNIFNAVRRLIDKGGDTSRTVNGDYAQACKSLNTVFTKLSKLDPTKDIEVKQMKGKKVDIASAQIALAQVAAFLSHELPAESDDK